jgi:hypothetical protein
VSEPFDFDPEAVAKAAVREAMGVSKSRDRLLPALTARPSVLNKAVGDAFAPLREAVEALAARLDRLEGRDGVTPR